ncbi:bestrophin-like domain [Streptomyces sp. 900105245]
MPLDVQILTWPPLALLIALLSGFLLIAAAGATICRKLRNDGDTTPSGETIALILSIYGAIYGVLLAFVVVIAWDDLNKAEDQVDAESASLAAVVRDADFLPADVRNHIATDMKKYLDHILNTEWVEMKQGRVPSASNSYLDGMLTTLKGYKPNSEREVADYERIRADLTTAIARHRDRIAYSDEQLPPLLQYFIFGGAISVILLACWYRPKDRLDQLILLTSICVLLASSLLIVLGLNHPFTGDISVAPDAYYRGILSQYISRQ